VFLKIFTVDLSFLWQNIIQHSLVHSVFFVAKYYSAFFSAFPDTAVGAGVAKELG